MGVSWPTGSRFKHSNWVRLGLMDQSHEMLLGHAIFASSEYRMTQLPSYCTVLHVRLKPQFTPGGRMWSLTALVLNLTNLGVNLL